MIKGGRADSIPENTHHNASAMILRRRALPGHFFNALSKNRPPLCYSFLRSLSTCKGLSGLMSGNTHFPAIPCGRFHLTR